MAHNIEIKAVCLNYKKVQETISTMNLPLVSSEKQVDTFFNVPNGRLKLRETSRGESVLIPYIRPDESGLRDSEYTLLKSENMKDVRRIMNKMFGIRHVVAKSRQIYLYDNIRIHLDYIEELGRFIELEAVINDDTQIDESKKKLNLLMEMLEIQEKDLINYAYVDLLEEL